VACTVLAMPDKENAPLLARTMDWQSFGIAGKYSLIVSRSNPATGVRTAEVGIPGLIGTITGVNNKGISVAMNITGYTGKVNTIEGLPSAIYNRMVLEQCATFEEGKEFVASHQPMGPYHLTVSDHQQCGTFSFYQEESYAHDWNKDRFNGHYLRMMQGKEKPLVTTNCTYTPEHYDMFNGRLRERLIGKYLNDNNAVDDPESVVQGSQSIPWVNNQLTTHRVLMGHNTLQVAFDNAWAGDRYLHPVDLGKLFTPLM
jgi:hypothetical protein